MVKLVNRAKMRTSTTGTGTITLGSAESGYQSFADAGVSDGDVVRYVIEDGTDWEIGTGTYTATGTTLTRTVDESSNADAAISLSGNAVVFVVAGALDVQQPPSEGSFVDGDKTKLDGIEANATADQTASEIKTAYESNANTNAFTDSEQSKLADIEAGADVTDTANVTSAGALMDSEVTNLAAVKAFDPADYATAAQGSLADTSVQPGDNVSSLTNDAGYTTNIGDITGVTAGTGLSGGGVSGSVTLNVDLSELTDMTATMVGTDQFIVLDAGADRRKAANEIGLSVFDNDAGYTTNIGDITGVTAGDALTGGGTSGTVTINHADTSTQASVNNSGTTVIQDVTIDTYGHVTSLGSTTLTIPSAADYVSQTSATGSAELPAGTTGERDGTPSAGYLRFNTSDGAFEGYDGTEWGALGGDSPVKARINFNGTGTVSTRESVNVSSLTDNGTGDYTVNYSNFFSTVGYSFAGMSSASAYAGTRPISDTCLSENSDPATSSVRVVTGVSGGQAYAGATFDSSIVGCSFTGDLA